MADRPTICLNMIVRDEAHVIEECLGDVVGHVDRWVIVDTGSTDGTQQVVREFFAERGVPGELHERPWRDFGTNRTEALDLAHDTADYLWVIDADDRVHGHLDLSGLEADAYALRYGPDPEFWRTQLFSTRRRWAYVGVLHEYPTTLDGEHAVSRLEGDYHVQSRREGARNLDPAKYDKDCAVLEDALEENPDDPRLVFYLAQSHMDAGRPDVAAEVYERRVGMTGWEEETFVAAWRRAQCLEMAAADRAVVIEAYLDAWQRRPSRAEPLVDLARWLRTCGDHDLAHLFAVRATTISFPDDDLLFVGRAPYDWSAEDEAAIAAFYVGREAESFERNDRLLWSATLPLPERERVLENRDYSVPAMLAEPVEHPAEVVARLTAEDGGAGDVTVTVTTCRRRNLFETTLDSFLTCATDLSRVSRWIVSDDGSSAGDLDAMRERYPFLEVLPVDGDGGHVASMNRLADRVDTRWWLHLEDDWRFFSRGDLIGRSVEVLEHDDEISQLLFNRNYAEGVAHRAVVGGDVRRTGAGHAYRVHEHPETAAVGPSSAWWPHFSLRPSVMDAAAVRSVGRFREGTSHFEHDFAVRYREAGLASGFLDTIVCEHIGRRTDDPDGGPNAYELAGREQFPGWGEGGPGDSATRAQ